MVTVTALFVFGFSQFAAAQKADETSELSGNGNRAIQISRSGKYRLSDDLKVRSGNAITITASNVTLDLAGYTVSTESGGTGRGVFVSGAKNVQIKNGKTSGFNANVVLMNSENVVVESLQIAGLGLAPNNGPTEIGVLLVNAWANSIRGNTISSVNLGIFVRGGNSTANRISENVVVGGANPANNLLGICYNPAPNAGTAGPRGDSIYNNHIARFGFAIAISVGSVHNIFSDNTLASFTGDFREPGTLTTGGGTNVSESNIAVTIPATVIQ